MMVRAGNVEIVMMMTMLIMVMMMMMIQEHSENCNFSLKITYDIV